MKHKFSGNFITTSFLVEDLHLKFEELEKKILQKIETLQKVIMDNNSKPSSFKFDDALKYNDTVRTRNMHNIYSYYWKITNVHNILGKSDLYITSPNFIIMGESKLGIMY